MAGKVIDGRKIAEELRKNIAKEVENIKLKYGKTPNITTVKIGDDPASNLYLRLREKACHEVGVESNRLEFPENISEKEILESIMKLNNDSNVYGILIQLPVPSHISQDNIIDALDPKKDVEGLNPYNLGRTLNGDEHLVPCTPLSVLTILDYENTVLEDKDVVIINHSNHVGKPLASLLLNRNATVSVCHVFTKDLNFFTKNADILITAVGVAKLIKTEHVKNNAFVIDVAIVSTSDGICGDVDFESVKDVVGKITPVPGGVGPITVACSLKNMIKTFYNFVEKNE